MRCVLQPSAFSLQPPGLLDPVISLTTLGILDLRDAAGRELRPLLQQPKRLALLLYLALESPRRFQRRDSLLALFWPDLDSDHARAALRRALYFLRQQLGDDVVINRAEDEVGIAPGRLVCDAAEFDRLLAAGDREAALALYHGDLLEGFFIAGAPDAERWLDSQRRRLQDRAAQAAWSLAEQTDAPEATAAEWARRAAAIDPHDEGGVRRLMTILAKAGDRAGALRVYDDLVRRLVHALEPGAEPETAALANTIRREVGKRGSGEVGKRDNDAALRPSPLPHVPTSPLSPGLVAVEPFAVRGDASLGYLAEGMMDLLLTALDGAGDLRTADPQTHGAEYVVQGSVVGAGGRLRVSATLRHAHSGDIVSRAEAAGTSEAALFDVVDALVRQLITARIAGPGARLARIAGVTTDSLPALKAYLRGEREMRLGRHFDAVQALGEATALDPAFALAHYRLAGACAATAMVLPAREASARAIAHRERLTERDRLLLDAQYAWLHGRVAEAERRYGTAVAAYPDDLEAWHLLGDLLMHSNPYRGRSIVEARLPLERAIALEPGHLGSLVKLARIAALEEDHARLDTIVTRVLAESPRGDQSLAMRALRAFALPREDEQREVNAELPSARALSAVTTFGDIALYTGDLVTAERIGREFVDIARSDELKALCHLVLAHLALAGGRVAAAMEALDRAEALEPSWALEVRGLFAALPFVPMADADRRAVRDSLERWDTAAARAKVSVPLLLHNALHAHLRAWLLGVLDARLGDLGASAAWGEALAELPVPDDAGPLIERLSRSLEAEARVRQHRGTEALRTLEGAGTDVWYQYAIASPFYSGTYDRFLRASLLERAGRNEDALGWYAAIAERSPWELPFAAPAALRAAAIHEQAGRSADAGRWYRRAAHLWRDCDEPLRALQRDAADRAEALV